MRKVVVGIDSGTQSTKVIVLDQASGETVALGRAPHSGHDTQNPLEWWTALRSATAQALAAAGNAEPVGIAVARGEPVAALAERWRPPTVERTEPRAAYRAAFRLPERRAIIAALRSPDRERTASR